MLIWQPPTTIAACPSPTMIFLFICVLHFRGLQFCYCYCYLCCLNRCVPLNVVLLAWFLSLHFARQPWRYKDQIRMSRWGTTSEHKLPCAALKKNYAAGYGFHQMTLFWNDLRLYGTVLQHTGTVPCCICRLHCALVFRIGLGTVTGFTLKVIMGVESFGHTLWYGSAHRWGHGRECERFAYAFLFVPNFFRMVLHNRICHS